jgi:uncharacterized protein YqiB (DUF1249 family)
MAIQTTSPKKQRYQVDLVALHALCEANYRRLLQLFPDYEQSNRRIVAIGEGELRLEVSERGRFTTEFQLRFSDGCVGSLGVRRMAFRAYHDAAMAEVIGSGGGRRVAPRYDYPNTAMYQRDEQFQQNQFAAELLAFCLANGRDTELIFPTAPQSQSASDPSNTSPLQRAERDA